ncbi:MAG TPA: DUF4383 domain-containing protein [Egibacteraceae bacterium]|nr:DUF4383 domain-containing protein [Egibacteraceae bacterium]
MSVNQAFGYAFGGVYILVGLLGFLVTGGVDLASPDGGLLLGIFEVNPLHNVVHLAIGAGFIAGAAGGLGSSRMVNTAIGGTYVLVALAGLAVPADSGANILALNAADHLLHFGSGAAALAVGLAADRARVREGATRAA